MFSPNFFRYLAVHPWELFGVSLLGRIPLDARLRECGDAGEPLVWAAPGSPAGLALAELAEAVEATRQTFKPLPLVS